MTDEPQPKQAARGPDLTPTAPEEQLRQAQTRLQILHEIDRGIIARHPVRDIVATALRALRPLLGVGRSSVFVFNHRDETATILAVDEDRPVPRAAVGTVRPLADIMSSQLREHPEPFVIRDLPTAAPDLRAADPLVAAGYTASGWVPMVVDGELVGVTIHTADDDSPFTLDRLEVAVEVAAQLAIAIRSERERQELEATTAHLRLMHEIDRIILEAGTPVEVAARVVDPIRALTGADVVGIAECDTTAGEAIVLAIAQDDDVSPAVQGRFPLDRLLSPGMIERPEVVVSRPDSVVYGPGFDLLRLRGLRTIVYVPLVSEQRLRGWISLAWRADDSGLVEILELAKEIGARLAVSFGHMNGQVLVERSRLRLALLHEIDQALLAATTSEQIASAVTAPLLALTGAAIVGIAEAGRDPSAGGSIIAYDGEHAAAVFEEVKRLPATAVLPPAARQQRQVVVVPDLRPVAAALAGGTAAVGLGLTKGMVIPLVVADRMLGAISLAGDDRMMLSEDAQAVAREVGDQLAIALDHVQSRHLLEEQADRLSLLGEIDRAILHSQAPAELAQAVADRIDGLVGSDATTINEFRDGRRYLLAATGMTPEAQERLRATPPEPIDMTVSEAVNDIVILTDLSAAVETWGGARFGVEIGMKVAALVPLLIGDRRVGLMTLASRNPALLEERNLATAREVGNQLAIALRQAEDRERLERAVARQELVHAIDRAILAADSITDLGARVADPLLRLLHGKRLDISEYDLERGEGTIIAFAQDGGTRPTPVGTRFVIREVVPLANTNRREPVVINSLAAVTSGLPLVRNAVAQGLVHGAWVPLWAGDELIGAIGVAGTDPRGADPDTIAAAREIGDQLAVAMKAARDRKVLADREARLSAILEASPNGILTVDPDGVIQYANPAAHRLFGYEDGTLVAGSILTLVPEGSVELRPDHVGAWFLLDATSHPLDIDARRRDGTTMPVHVLLARVETAEGPRAIATVVDLSERTELEQRLRQAERLETLGQFAGILAHDVRNYLTAVSWSADLLAGDMEPGDPRLEDVALIKRATQDAVDMTRSVLEFSRPASTTPGIVDVARHLTGARAMLGRILGDDIRLEITADDGLPAATIDSTGLTQVVGNLATNARDAMPAGGLFRVHASVVEIGAVEDAEAPHDPGRFVRITATDSGVGMDEETRRRAFEAFYTTKAGGQERRGTGLGLSSVFLIVSRAGGTIHLASEVGTGTTFTIDLPAIR